MDIFWNNTLPIQHYLFLQEIIGSVGGKLHTGRSRNDQVKILSIDPVQVLVFYKSVADSILNLKNFFFLFQGSSGCKVRE